MSEISTKEITDGIVIHCKSQREMEILCKELNLPTRFINYWERYGEKSCVSYERSGNVQDLMVWSYSNLESYMSKGCAITEFEDLVLNDLSEMENSPIKEACTVEHCPSCKSKLNIDEKSSGKCFSCGTTFDPFIPDANKQIEGISSDNIVANLIKICGVIIMILGTIGSIIIAGGDGYKYEFSLIHFLVPEVISIVGGLLFIGFAEIIQLLEDIKSKLK